VLRLWCGQFLSAIIGAISEDMRPTLGRLSRTLQATRKKEFYGFLRRQWQDLFIAGFMEYE
jgi:hypothetical protein